jgi:hypothetical protein
LLIDTSVLALGIEKYRKNNNNIIKKKKNKEVKIKTK